MPDLQKRIEIYVTLMVTNAWTKRGEQQVLVATESIGHKESRVESLSALEDKLTWRQMEAALVTSEGIENNFNASAATVLIRRLCQIMYVSAALALTANSN